MTLKRKKGKFKPGALVHARRTFQGFFLFLFIVLLWLLPSVDRIFFTANPHLSLTASAAGRFFIPAIIPALLIIVTAAIDTSKCLPWIGDSQCLQCRYNCPVPGNAVGILQKEGHIFLRPEILPDLCMGCGRCQNVCPVRPHRAVKVDSSAAQRS